MLRKSAYLLCLSLCASMLLAADDATITYRRVFKESVPELIEIKVSENGPASYDIRQLSETSDPETASVSPVVREKIFALASRLRKFEAIDLDAHRKLADLGKKTLRYEKGATAYETSFNYTVNNDAVQLVTLFEGLAQQQLDLDKLARASKYDHLGVNDALRQIDNDLDRRLLPEPAQLLPVLDGIIADERIVEIARQRARSVAQRIRGAQSN